MPGPRRFGAIDFKLCSNMRAGGAINCYSCMSYIYGANWEYLEYKDLYFRPAAFTDRCTNISEHGGHIGRIPCLHNCILIVEKMRVDFKWKISSLSVHGNQGINFLIYVVLIFSAGD
ncbi:hypothetical protein Tsp_05861 [Trichinella spiralis]|uniref:hypothetical protein n=1 Tax=Trichinella spiralis TaxID=6334 RepID=UPI0001EFC3D8|nr:hypothetical protein Tsp_05861 [Trichinella spiralis]